MLKFWHLASHKRIKQGNREGGFAVPLRPYHALVDQLLSYWPNIRGINTQDSGDITRLVRPRPQLRHGPEILLLKQRQAIKSDPKEIVIEVTNDPALSSFDIFSPYWT